MNTATTRQGRWRVPAPPHVDTDWYADPRSRYLKSPEWFFDPVVVGPITDATPVIRMPAIAPEPTVEADTAAKVPPIDDSRSLLESSASQTVGTLLSRVTGLGRVVAMSVILGQSLFTDQFNNANTAPNMIYELLLGGVLSATLVPLFAAAVDSDDDRGTDALVTTAVVALGGLTVLAVIGAPLIHYCFTFLLPASERAHDATVVVPLMRLLLPQIFLYGLMTIVTAALHARNRFAAVAFTPVFANLVFIATFVLGGVFYGDEIRAGHSPTGLILLLGIGTTLGVAVMVFTTFFAVYDAGISFRWRFAPKDPVVLELVRLSGWTLGYAAVNQVTLMILTAIARRDATTLSAYQTAFVFFQLPHGLIAVSVMNSVVPLMSRSFAANNLDNVRSKYREGMSVMTTVILPAAVLLGVLATPLVQVCLGYGLFAGRAQALTGATVAAFALGLPGFSVYLFTLRTFYAQKDTKTPFLLNVGQNGLNIVAVLAVLATHPARPAVAMAMAYSLSYTVAAIAAVIAAGKRVPGMLSRQVGTDLAKALAIATVVAVEALLLGHLGGLTKEHDLAQIIITSLIALVTIVGGVSVMQSYGFDAVVSRIRKTRTKA